MIVATSNGAARTRGRDAAIIMRQGPPAEAVIPQRRKAIFYGFALTGSARLGEFAVLLLLGLILRHWRAPAELAAPILVAPFAAAAFSILARAGGAYGLSVLRAPFEGFLRAAGAWVGAMLGAAALGFVFGAHELSTRGWLGLWLAAGLFCLLGLRLLAAFAASLLARRGRLDRYVVIVGGGPQAEDLLHELSRTSLPDVRILGLFDDRCDDRALRSRRGLSQARDRRRPDRLRPECQGRSDPVRAAGPCRGAHSRYPEPAVGAADRHQAGGARQPSALSPARLFLPRRRAPVRSDRQADVGIGHRRQSRLRSGRRPRPDRAVCAGRCLRWRPG